MYSPHARMKNSIWAMNLAKRDLNWDRSICFPSVYVKIFHILGHLIRKNQLESGLIFYM